MNSELRERTILPVLIPVGAIVITEIVVFSLSRVLLASGKYPAVAIAMGTALAILIGSATVAARPRLKTASIVTLLAFGLIVAVVAGAVALKAGPSYEREEAANIPTIQESAKNIAFAEKMLKLSAAGTHIHFTNADSQPHNIAIFKSEKSLDQPLFRGEIQPPGAATTYNVGKLGPGSYYFHCDVHPQMHGKAVVA
jgi:plastocyanin